MCSDTDSIDCLKDILSSFDTQMRMLSSTIDADEYKQFISTNILDNHAGYILMMMSCFNKRRILYIGNIEPGVAMCLNNNGLDIYVCSPNINKLSFITKRCLAEKKKLNCICSDYLILPFKKKIFDFIIVQMDSFAGSYLGQTFYSQKKISLDTLIANSIEVLKREGRILILSGNRSSFNHFFNFLKMDLNKEDSIFSINRSLNKFKMNVTNFYGINIKTGDFYPFKMFHKLLFEIPYFMQHNILCRTIKQRFKSFFTCIGFATPAFAIEAGFLNLSKPNLYNIIENVIRDLSQKNSMVFSDPVVTGMLNRKTQRIMIRICEKNKLYSSILIKIPYGEWANLGESSNFKALEFLHESKQIPSQIKFLIPKPVFKGKISGLMVYAETFFHQTSPISEINNFTGIEKTALDVISLLHRSTQKKQQLTNALFNTLIVEPLKRIKKFCYNEKQIDCFYIIKNYIYSTLGESVLPLVFVHGDFHKGNILIALKSKELVGIIDWETSVPKGLPALDLFFLLLEPGQKGLRVIWEFIELLLKYPYKIFQNKPFEFIEEYCESIGLKKKYLPALVILFWATQIASRGLSPNKRYDSQWLEDNIYVFMYQCSNIISENL